MEKKSICLTWVLTVSLLIVVFIGNICCAADVPSNWGKRKAVSFESLKINFCDPEMIYAPFMFWFWDEPLDPGKMAEMSGKIASQRLNPGYAHARSTGPGIHPPRPLPKEQWLSDLWFEAFGAALSEAEKAGAYLSYCDEYMWPSFQAAGRVLNKHPELQSVFLDYDIRDVAGGGTVEIPACFFAVAARHGEPVKTANHAIRPRLGQWVWRPAGASGRHQCYFRKTFTLCEDAEVAAAAIRLSVDNSYVLYVNGREIGRCDNWMDVRTWDVKKALVEGVNVIAVEAGGDGSGKDAMNLGLRVELENRESVEVISDGSWRVSEEPEKGWTKPDFKDDTWASVCVVENQTNAGPWYIENKIPKEHPRAVILSRTLRVIEDAKPFNWQAPPGGQWRVYIFQKRKAGTVNYIDERLADVFISIAHEPYVEHLAEKLGNRMPGVFVDNEGNYGHELAWSDTLERYYKRKFGKDIRLWMPLMLDRDVEGRYACARWNWFEAVSDLYARTMGSVSRWCEKRGMYCIENLWEESLQWQAQFVGDFFKLSRVYSMPGNDALVRGAVHVHDFKEVQSVCEFEGRRFMNEIMGAGGWGHFNPVFMKQAANAVIAWGVGHVVPHGIFTNRNLTGGQWTPDWYDENPMFPYLHIWADFVRRASYINSHGHLVPDVLLVNPMDSVWVAADSAIFDPSLKRDLVSTVKWFGPQVEHINRIYSNAIVQLTKHRVEFLIADRYYIGKMRVRGASLVYGDFVFRSVILPPMVVLPLEVSEKIVAFARNGGKVYALGQLPCGSVEHGVSCSITKQRMAELSRLPGFIVCENKLEDELEDPSTELAAQLRFRQGAFEMLQHHMRIDGRDFFWLVNNTEKEQSCRVTISDVRGLASIWDCESGMIIPIASQSTPQGSALNLFFKPLQAYWLVFDAGQAELSKPVMGKVKTQLVREVTGSWLTRVDPAVQPVLEYPVEIPSELKEGAARELTHWEDWPGMDKFSGLIDYEKSVIVEETGSRMLLDLGKVYHFAQVWVNGRHVGEKLWPPFVFEITDGLIQGRNVIRIRIGNLVGNNYGQRGISGLSGPVRILKVLD